jgi:hypothetical protein
MKTIWTSAIAWAGIALAALMFAVTAPRDASVMGRLPELKAQWANQQPVAFPQGLPAERTLALVTFHRDHRKDAESWINGLQLRNDPSIAWVRMPVINDPKDPVLRGEVESRLLSRYTSDAERLNLHPVFTDRAAFIQSAGLGDAEHAHVLVVNREGEVLARVSGQYDEAKGRALRQTLSMQGF